MDDDSNIQKVAKWGLGLLGLSAVGAAVAIPKIGMIGLWLALGILLLGLILFGSYYLWHRRRARRNREMFSSAIEVQAAAAPRSISDPKKRADLDKVREKFQTGLEEFKSRGKDIYKLPWYVIIGESGSGKTEAIRHSEIDFPPGLNREHQGSGGTVNMDWWFTNRGVILDTAGSMVFPEAGAGGDSNQQWQEFLRLLKKARPHCPVNGLFLVLSIESIIRDSADRISQKASRLAQQLDMIQRTLDVRFPVYLLITKSDLLTGFREFFDSIEDPLLQHQIFGWSNPDPLDSPFRPDLVDQHLDSIAQKVRRRRLAMLRESSSSGGRVGDTSHFFASSYQLGRGVAAPRRLDEVDSLFAFPESIMRLAPRLRRYLETIFVAGEWSAKPVFLRGIYFTSSMREGKALDEAMAFATGLSLDQLPEDRTWEKNRAYFLRDLFHEKVFRESGLVTRATNTLKMLRQRQIAIFGTAAAALVLLLVFAGFAGHSLRKRILVEASYWKAGADPKNWSNKRWSPGIVKSDSADIYHFVYTPTNQVDVAERPTVVEYHRRLKEFIEKGLHVSFIFKPISVFSKAEDREEAQRLLFEAGVLRPLILETREKMKSRPPPADNPDAVRRHRDALLALIKLEADKLSTSSRNGNLAMANTNGYQRADDYLKTLVSYLTDSEQRADTNLTSAFCWTYSKMGSGAGKWPPPSLLGGDRLANNSAIQAGLDGFRKANQAAQMNIVREVDLANNLVASASNYQQLEMQWLANPAGSCEFITKDLAAANDTMGKSWVALQAATNFTQWPLTNIAFRYKKLEQNAKYASSDSFKDITSEIPDEYKRQGIIAEILEQVNKFASESAQIVSTNYQPRSTIIAQLDNNYVSPPTNSSTPAYRLRWMLYSNACAIASAPAVASPEVLGDGWKRYGELKVLVDGFRTSLVSYVGPLASVVSNVCDRLASDAEHRSKTDFVSSYAKLVQSNCSEWKLHAQWDTSDVAKARSFFTNVTHDLDPSNCGSLEPPQRQTLEPLRAAITETKRAVLAGIEQDLNRKMGFPVRLSSAQEKTIPELGALRKLVDAIKVELANPVWQSDNNDAFSSLQQSCARYEPLIGMLVSGNGAPTEWELFFVGQPNNSADWAVTSIFRSLKVAFKDQETKTISDLSRVVTTKPVSLGKAGIATGLGLTFQKSDSDPTPPAVQPEPQQNWWLPRFLSFSSEEPVPSNGAWHFRLKLEESKNKTQGFVFFEARPLDPATPLPTKWPK